jgi:GTPase
MAKRSMVVSLIGRPNVGKSSIFNRLMRKGHKAITYDLPGVTRDRHYGIASFQERSDLEEAQVIVVDTGGFYPQKVETLPGKSEAAFNSQFFNIMTEQAQMAIDESDLVLFIVDVREGALPFDESIAENLRHSKKRFWLVVNKFDSDKQYGDEADFYRLGIDHESLFLTSAEHGLGLSELREALQREALQFRDRIADDESEQGLHRGVAPREEVVGRMALIGAPNVGKSTLLNLLVGADRALVSDIPGTTVDPIEGFFDLYFGERAQELEQKDMPSFNDGLLLKQYDEFRRNNPDVYQALSLAYEAEELAHGEEVESEEELVLEGSYSDTDDVNIRLYNQAFEEESSQNELADEVAEEQTDESSGGSHWRSVHIVDTAGIRRQKNIESFIESQSVYRSLRCITESDVVLYLVDCTKGIGHQDRRLMDITLEKGKSLILVLNKIDLLRDQLKTPKDRQAWIENLRIDLPWLDFVDLVPISAKNRRGIGSLKKIMVKTMLVRHRRTPTAELNRFLMDLIDRHPVAAKGKRFKVKYASMIKTDPPTFLLFTNLSKGIPDSYRRYLTNGLRRAFSFDNTPLHLIFRTGQDLRSRMKKVGAKDVPAKR